MLVVWGATFLAPKNDRIFSHTRYKRDQTFRTANCPDLVFMGLDATCRMIGFVENGVFTEKVSILFCGCSQPVGHIKMILVLKFENSGSSHDAAPRVFRLSGAYFGQRPEHVQVS